MTADLPDKPDLPDPAESPAEAPDGSAEQAVAGGPVAAGDALGTGSAAKPLSGNASRSIDAPVTRDRDESAGSPADEPAGGYATDAAANLPAERAVSPIRSILTTVLAVWLLAALVAAGWFGVGWVRAAYFTDAPRAEARDSALDSARQAAINLSSMNPNDIDGSIDLMKSSMTGSMLDQLTQNRDRIKQAAEQSKTKIDAKVLGASLSTLNSERDKATALVVLQLTQSAPSVPAESFRTTWSLDMAKVGDGWKAEQANSLGQLVPLDSPNPAQPAPTGIPVPPASPATPAPQPGS
ncbi:hypothetical protein [Nocardia aurantia]|uniref:Mce-associated membrane protein n=1 Tax=Nocardia aurantia TaxID=2585199 RepID=A0A7K0DZK6_9NOCA|nr:hypothetical protein [Nocardia aurantia]MQY30284.1 hypothetical protein [Nocardia aurantia]